MAIWTPTARLWIAAQESTKRHEGKAAYGMEEISLVDRSIPGAVLAHLEANIKLRKG